MIQKILCMSKIVSNDQFHWYIGRKYRKKFNRFSGWVTTVSSTSGIHFYDARVKFKKKRESRYRDLVSF